MAHRYESLEEIAGELHRQPEKFTEWFRIAFEKFKEEDAS
jgi:hypothetical protein